MTRIKPVPLYGSNSRGLLYSSRHSTGFKFDLDLYLKECEEEDQQNNAIKSAKNSNNLKEKKSAEVVTDIKEKQRTVSEGHSMHQQNKYKVQKGHHEEQKSSDIQYEITRSSQKCVKIQPDRRWETLEQPNNMNNHVRQKDCDQPNSEGQEKDPRDRKGKKNFTAERRRLSAEQRRGMEKRYWQRLKKQEGSKIVIKSETPGKCQSAREPQRNRNICEDITTSRMKLISPRSLDIDFTPRTTEYDESIGCITTDLSETDSYRSIKFLMSKSELNLHIQQIVDETFLEMEQQKQLQRKLEAQRKWNQAKLNFLKSRSVESFKAMIAAFPNVKDWLNEDKSFVLSLKEMLVTKTKPYLLWITLVSVFIFSWIYEFGEPMDRIHNALHDLFADNSKRNVWFLF